MAWIGQRIENPVSGERIIFRRTSSDTNGKLLEFDDFWTRPNHRVPKHIHPQMEERWLVMSGRVKFCINDFEQTAGPGDEVIASAGSSHMSWNVGGSTVHLRTQMRPAFRWEEFVERWFAAASKGKTDRRGLPEPTLLRDLMREFHHEITMP